MNEIREHLAPIGEMQTQLLQILSKIEKRDEVSNTVSL